MKSNTAEPLILGVILISFCTGAFAPFGCKTTITGTVTNQDGDPVEGATVTIEGFSSATTGADGIYTIEDVKYGHTTITVTCDGYEDKTSDIDTSYLETGLACKEIEGTDIQLTSSSIMLLEENFESYTTGTFPDNTGGWHYYVVIGTVSGHIDSDVAALNTAKSLRLEAENGSQMAIVNNFSPPSITSIDIEGYFRGNSTSTELNLGVGRNEWGGVTLANYGGALQVWYGEESAEFKDTGLIFEKDTWYKIRINIDISSGTWHVWVNDNNETEGNYDDTVIPPMVACGLYKSGVLGKAYFDEITVSYPRSSMAGAVVSNNIKYQPKLSRNYFPFIRKSD